MEEKKLLITGCGRSGTLYSTEIWRALGLDIRHERPITPNGVMGADGMSSWFMTVDDLQPPSGPSAVGYKFDLVIQQVRHPLKVIASVAQFILRDGLYAPGFIERNVPEITLSFDQRENFDYREQLILRAARYWYYWNRLAEKKADIFVQVEHLKSELPGLCDLLGLDYNPVPVKDISSNINARQNFVLDQPWVVDWQEIFYLDPQLYYQIRNLAAGYGYDE